METSTLDSDGFTLLELMVVMVIIGILMMIALPTYKNHIRKVRRHEAIKTILGIQLAEEKYYFEQNSFGSLANVWGEKTTEGGHYTLEISNQSDDGYRVIAIAQGAQAQDKVRDITCKKLTLTVLGNNETKSPAECWDK